jgi:TetR/AcrR family transcriptional regulator, transcriptional repressor of bet genes
MPAPARHAAPRPTRLRRVDSEDARRRQLIEATVDAIGDVGFAATTIAEIARRAEVSTGLVSFYFGDKDGLLEATLRHLARELARGVAMRLRDAATPRDRVQAVIDANLGESQFQRRIGTVWLAFWGQVPHSPRFARVQRAYQRRIASNLAAALRPLAPRREALALAEQTAAMIDGLWLRATLSRDADGRAVRAVAGAFVDAQLAALPALKDPAP